MRKSEWKRCLIEFKFNVYEWEEWMKWKMRKNEWDLLNEWKWMTFFLYLSYNACVYVPVCVYATLTNAFMLLCGFVRTYLCVNAWRVCALLYLYNTHNHARLCTSAAIRVSRRVDTCSRFAAVFRHPQPALLHAAECERMLECGCGQWRCCGALQRWRPCCFSREGEKAL